MKELMTKIGFDDDEILFFSDLYKGLSSSIISKLDDLKAAFFNPGESSDTKEVCNYVCEELTAISESINCHKYSLHLLFLLYCAEELKTRYLNKGLDISLYYDLLCDITYKLQECKKVHNIMGTDSFNWFHNHFLITLFALGRFQYIKGEFHSDKEYRCGDVCVKPGDPVYYIHIPSSGGMPEEERMHSYKKAYDFFGCNNGNNIILVCESWLLYPPNRFIFPENSNLMSFFNDFDIISSIEPLVPFRNAWRVFNKDYTGDTSELPRETTLQKNYIKWLEAGNQVGNGYGIIIFDGNKIINKH